VVETARESLCGSCEAVAGQPGGGRPHRRLTPSPPAARRRRRVRRRALVCRRKQLPAAGRGGCSAQRHAAVPHVDARGGAKGAAAAQPWRVGGQPPAGNVTGTSWTYYMPWAPPGRMRGSHRSAVGCCSIQSCLSRATPATVMTRKGQAPLALGHSAAGGAHSPLARTRSTTRLHGSLPLGVSAAASSALAAQSWTRKPLLCQWRDDGASAVSLSRARVAPLCLSV